MRFSFGVEITRQLWHREYGWSSTPKVARLLKIEQWLFLGRSDHRVKALFLLNRLLHWLISSSNTPNSQGYCSMISLVTRNNFHFFFFFCKIQEMRIPKSKVATTSPGGLNPCSCPAIMIWKHMVLLWPHTCNAFFIID